MSAASQTRNQAPRARAREPQLLSRPDSHSLSRELTFGARGPMRAQDGAAAVGSGASYHGASGTIVIMARHFANSSKFRDLEVLCRAPRARI